VQRFSQCDGGGFAFVKASDRVKALRLDDLKPDGRAGDPALNRQRRDGVGKFVLTALGRITLSNRRGRSSIWPIRIR
jgi:hypothetical protein